MEDAPLIPCTDDARRQSEELQTVIPEDPNIPYDIKDIIEPVMDNQYFFEVMPHFALVGGRVAVNRGSGGSLPMGSAAGGLLCLILGLVCLGTTGTEGFHGQFVGILLMTLAGGWLAGLMGKKKRKKKKR